MLVGSMRVCNACGSQSLALAGIEPDAIHDDRAPGKLDGRPWLGACLKALREGDVLVMWRLDRLGRSMAHLVETVEALAARGVGFRVLSGHGTQARHHERPRAASCSTSSPPWRRSSPS